MAFEWFACKGACSGSDPVSDTVKVDPSLLASQKENVRPLQPSGNADETQTDKELERRAQEFWLQQKREREAEARQQAEQQARRKRDEERRREEQAAAERAATERAAAEAAAAEAAAAEKAKQEQLRLEAEEAAKERARQDREAVEKAAALLRAQRREEERLAQEKVDAWCKANGFADMNSKKKSLMSGSRFALHELVAKHDEEMVGLMVLLGVDKGVKNSKGQTPVDLARKLNKGGSMDAIIAKLS